MFSALVIEQKTTVELEENKLNHLKLGYDHKRSCHSSNKLNDRNAMFVLSFLIYHEIGPRGVEQVIPKLRFVKLFKKSWCVGIFIRPNILKRSKCATS